MHLLSRSKSLSNDTDYHENLYDLYKEKPNVLTDNILQTSKWCIFKGIPVKIVHIKIKSINGKESNYIIKYYFGLFKNK
jgi:hypothetical protein